MHYNEYILRLGFKASNCEMEYKALLATLCFAFIIGTKNLDIFYDFQFVVSKL